MIPTADWHVLLVLLVLAAPVDARARRHLRPPASLVNVRGRRLLRPRAPDDCPTYRQGESSISTRIVGRPALPAKPMVMTSVPFL
jgi:hypothetical protein